jgi:hypothetical protein
MCRSAAQFSAPTRRVDDDAHLAPSRSGSTPRRLGSTACGNLPDGLGLKLRQGRLISARAPARCRWRIRCAARVRPRFLLAPRVTGAIDLFGSRRRPARRVVRVRTHAWTLIVEAAVEGDLAIDMVAKHARRESRDDGARACWRNAGRRRRGADCRTRGTARDAHIREDQVLPIPTRSATLGWRPVTSRSGFRHPTTVTPVLSCSRPVAWSACTGSIARPTLASNAMTSHPRRAPFLRPGRVHRFSSFVEVTIISNLLLAH